MKTLSAKFTNKQLFGEPLVADLPLSLFNENQFSPSGNLDLEAFAPGFWLDMNPTPPQIMDPSSSISSEGPMIHLQKSVDAPNSSSPEEDFFAALKQIHSHETLNRGIERCQRCNFYQNREQSVISRGTGQSALMILADYPSTTENRAGLPLMGPEGDLLNKMLLAINQNPEHTFITLLLKCGPPSNLSPSNIFHYGEQVQSCLPYLKKQVELVKPKVLLILGEFAAKLILNFSESLETLRSQWHPPTILGKTSTVKVRVTYHPRDLIANPQLKRLAWNDLQAIKKELP